MGERGRGNGSQLSTSRFDRLQAFLLSANGLVGCLVLGLFNVWLLGSGDLDSSIEDGIVRVPDDWSEKSEEQQVLTDFPEDLIEQVAFERMIEAIPAVTDELSRLQDGGYAGDNEFNFSPGKRQPGPPPPEVPEWKRWLVNYQAEDIEAYAEQLDALGIELGAVALEENRIVRLSQISGDIQKKTTDRAAEQGSQYFVQKKKQLRKWDRLLVRGVELDFEFHLVHFFSDELTAKMRSAELNYVNAQGNSLEEIQRTSFEFVQESGGWNIRVAKMEFIENGKGQ